MFRQIIKSILIFYCLYGVECQNPVTETPQGRISGGTRSNIDGGTFYSFQTIPYGKPPIGDLRFRAPEPSDPWEGTRDGTQAFPQCVQANNYFGQEDCLYLNVYTPGLPTEGVTNLPVMVWIHGGGFNSGSAIESSCNGNFLLTKDVILVTINYRLGIFGFLSLDDPDLGVTGNAGLKDQILALQWVKDNIQYFGGNPNNVVIFGESAGSMSVQLLLLSPMANGLFQKAIAQSGDALSPMIEPATRNNGEAIAEALGIQTQNWEEMLVSLQAASVNDLALAEVSFDVGFFKLFAGPTVEISSNVSTFLDRDPLDIIRSGDYNKVPFITGVTDAEGLVFQFNSRSATGESILIEDFSEFVPKELIDRGNENLVLLNAFLIQHFYYGDEEPSRDSISEAVALTTDSIFAASSYRTTNEYLKTSENPIYFYYFTAKAEFSYLGLYDQTIAEYPGAAHADDLCYIFDLCMTQPLTAGSVEDRIIRSMVELWTNFAIYGNPTPEDSSDFIWEPVQEDQFNYLEIGTDDTFPILNSIFTQTRMEFWRAMYAVNDILPTRMF